MPFPKSTTYCGPLSIIDGSSSYPDITVIAPPKSVASVREYSGNGSILVFSISIYSKVNFVEMSEKMSL